jgi:hypothetical protein
MSLRKPIDWTKTGLRVAYLVEGIFMPPNSLSPQFVRWCGPPGRTGSGFTAYATLGPLSFPPSQSRPGELPLAPVAWETRLTRGRYDSTIGDLSQTVQALSDVTCTVALGDDDNPTTFLAADELRDMAQNGRWRGQSARLILVDMDDIDSFEVVVDGTWDKDPDGINAQSFKITINSDGSVAPSRRYLTGQVPDTVDNFQTYNYHTSTWIQSPNGSASPAFRLNPNLKGKWCPEIIGGARNEDIWRELVPYGQNSTHSYAWVSSRYDQFCYDIVVETESGLVKISADASRLIRVFNNNDPTRGPTGTCVLFSTPSGFSWDGTNSKTYRAFGKVAGGHPVLRPAGYSDIGFTGNPELGSNIPTSGGEAAPSNSTPPPGVNSDVTRVFKDLIVEGHFLNMPSMLHPSAISQLTIWMTLNSLPFPRNATLPQELPDKPLTYRDVFAPLMLSIPADLILKRDDSDPLGTRKFYAVVRQQPGDAAEHTITVGDLADASLPPRVTQLSDPDGHYSNDTTIRTEDFFISPVVGTSDGDDLTPTNSQVSEIVNATEQSFTAQAIDGETELPIFRYDSNSDFRAWAAVIERERSRPQVVLQATLGTHHLQRELGDRIQFDCAGVYHGPGHIRSMRVDLDAMVVTVRSYHQKSAPAVRTTSTINDKTRVMSERRRG